MAPSEHFDGRIYFRLLAAVAAADGEIDEAEVHRFGRLLTLAGADPEVALPLCESALQHVGDPLWFLQEVPESREFVSLCLRDALIMTAVDGWSSSEERALIEQAAARMNASDLLRDLPDPSASTPHPSSAALDLGEASLREVTAEVESSLATAHAYERHEEGFDPSIYFRLLAATAAADGEVLESEVSRFADLLELFGTDRSYARPLCREAMLRQRDPLWFLERVDTIDPHFAETLMHEATMVAMADDHYHREEHHLLEQAAQLLGVPDFPLPELEAPPPPPPPELSESQKVDRVDRALRVTSGVAIASGSAWVLVGGPAAKMLAGLGAVFGAGFGGWLAPLVLLLGAGVASSVLHILRLFGREGSHDA